MAESVDTWQTMCVPTLDAHDPRNVQYIILTQVSVLLNDCLPDMRQTAQWVQENVKV